MQISVHMVPGEHLTAHTKYGSDTFMQGMLETRDVVIGRGSENSIEHEPDKIKFNIPDPILSTDHVVIGLRNGVPRVWIKASVTGTAPKHADWDGDNSARRLLEMVNAAKSSKTWSRVPRKLASTHDYSMPILRSKLFKVGEKGHLIAIKIIEKKA